MDSHFGSSSGATPDPASRLVRLEEVQAHTEHTVDQLNQEIYELTKKLSQTLGRLDHLEKRMMTLNNQLIESGGTGEVGGGESREAGADASPTDLDEPPIGEIA